MNKRTSILAVAFGVFVAYALVSRVVYPTWIEPLLTIDERIAKRQKDLDRLEEEAARVEEAQYKYRTWAERVGGFDHGRVVTEVRDRLNKLIEKHKLEEAKVSPSRPREDRKTKLTSVVLTVSAMGTLESSIRFMRDIAELPELCRIQNVAIYPAGSSRKNLKSNRVNLRVPVELWVLPQQKILGWLEDGDLVHPQLHVRHSDRDYSRIWSGEPFSDYIPLKAQATPSVTVEKGKQAKLDVRASGGSGDYTFSWAPVKGLSDATAPSPTVDTSTPGSNRYTVTVTDARGHTAQATVSVTVREPPAPPVVAEKVPAEPPPPPPPPSGPTRWPDGQYTDLRMALLSSAGTQRFDEFMVYNSRSKETTYHKVGDPFDDGELVFVHQTGGLVRTKNEYFVYPLGGTLNERLAADSAEEYPELVDAAARHREALRLASEPVPDATPKGGADAGPVPEGPAEKAADAAVAPSTVEAAKPEVKAVSGGVDGTKKPAGKQVESGGAEGIKKPVGEKVKSGEGAAAETEQPPKKRRPKRNYRTRRK